jgi:broad specificity phosphatase PhoE
VRLCIVRHAEPAYPEDTLTPRGHRQARALAHRLAAAGVDAVASSPMNRALETARYTADLAGLPCTIEPWTGELEHWVIVQGPLTEAPAWEIHPHAVRSAAPLHGGNWHGLPLLDAALVREGFEELRRASDAFLAGHGLIRQGTRYRAERPAARHLALFCHAGFGLTWLAHLLEIPPPLLWAGFSLPPSSVTTVAFEPDSEGWATPRCLSLGDLSHLAGEPPG